MTEYSITTTLVPRRLIFAGYYGISWINDYLLSDTIEGGVNLLDSFCKRLPILVRYSIGLVKYALIHIIILFFNVTWILTYSKAF